MVSGVKKCQVSGDLAISLSAFRGGGAGPQGQEADKGAGVEKVNTFSEERENISAQLL